VAELIENGIKKMMKPKTKNKLDPMTPVFTNSLHEVRAVENRILE
jgi:hypothetical protein